MYCELCSEHILGDSSFREFCGSPVKEMLDESVNEPINIEKEKTVKKC